MTEPCENIELCQIEMAEEYNHSCRYIIFDEEGRPAPDSAGIDYLAANSEDVDNTVLNGSGSSNAVFNVSTAGINRGYLTPLSSPSLNMGYSDPDKPSPGQTDVECIDIQMNSREGPEYCAPIEDEGQIYHAYTDLYLEELPGSEIEVPPDEPSSQKEYQSICQRKQVYLGAVIGFLLLAVIGLGSTVAVILLKQEPDFCAYNGLEGMFYFNNVQYKIDESIQNSLKNRSRKEVMDDCHKQKMTLIQSSDLSAIKNGTGHQATEMWQILNARRYYWLGDKDSSEKDGRKCKFAIFEIHGSGIYTKHESTAKNWNCNKISKDFLGFCKAKCIMKK